MTREDVNAKSCVADHFLGRFMRATLHSSHPFAGFQRFSIGPRANRTMAHLTQPSGLRNDFCLAAAKLAFETAITIMNAKVKTDFTQHPYRQ
jgi:hypothetical protein